MVGDENICIHGFVSGKVQGVFFRASSQEEAAKLGLTGWVRNLSDGRVEVFACGPKRHVDKFREWLKIGPRNAKVTECEIKDVEWQSFRTFEIAQ